MEFKDFLLEFRAKHNLTQVQAAKVIGVSKNMIHRYESGENNPTARNKIKIKNKMEEWEKKTNVEM